MGHYYINNISRPKTWQNLGCKGVTLCLTQILMLKLYRHINMKHKVYRRRSLLQSITVTSKQSLQEIVTRIIKYQEEDNAHFSHTVCRLKYIHVVLLCFAFGGCTISYCGYIQCIYPYSSGLIHRCAWWRHQMETFSAFLALCAGNSPVTGEFPSQRPVTRSFDVFMICAWIKCWVIWDAIALIMTSS